MELPSHPHDHRIGEVGDASGTTAVLLLVHAVPVDGLAEGLFLDEVVSEAEHALGSARSLEVLDRYYGVCGKERKEILVSKAELNCHSICFKLKHRKSLILSRFYSNPMDKSFVSDVPKF